MRKEKIVVSSILAWAAVAASLQTAAAVPPGALALQDAFADVAAKGKPAVVNISVVQEQRVQAPNFMFGGPEDFLQQFMQESAPRYRKFYSQGTGSGFIVDSKGYCITNDHVVRGAADIRVTLTRSDGKEKTYPGRIISRDPNLDLAVVKIQSNETFPYLSLAQKSPRVGDWAIAIGSPFTLQHTVTAGIVSAVRQSFYIEGRRYPNLIQTDAAINQGNSGGPLLNVSGEVIGVNTAIFSPSGAYAGIGFAIPATEVKTALGYLLAGKRMHQGWLGIETQPIDDVIQKRFGLPSTDGALVNSVFPKSPAEKAGLRRGDAIHQFDGKPVGDPQDLVAAASGTEAGKKVEIGIYRHGTPLRLTLALGERPDWADQQGASPSRSRLAAPQNAPPDQEENPPAGTASLRWEGAEFESSPEGVVVAQIAANSPLAGSLLQGDVLRGVNDAPVNTLEDLRAAARRVKISDGLFLDVLREGQPLYISIKP